MPANDTDRPARIGRARTVLVFGSGTEARAVVSSIVARVRRASGRRRRLAFRGAAGFAPETVAHILDTVLAVVDEVTGSLGVSARCFEVSAVNVGVASSSNVGLTISGFSADAAVLLALLSAALKLPIPQDLAVTGHVASLAGDLGPVASLPTKLAAAADDPSIRRLLCPPVDPDGSVGALAPSRKDLAEDAVGTAKGSVQTVFVSDICGLLQAACTDAGLVEAALRKDFFEGPHTSANASSMVARAIAFLTQGHENRFWRVLGAYLFGGEDTEAKELLHIRLRHQLRVKRYPSGFGGRLLQLVRSLPLATRRLKTAFPLLAMADCLKLARMASDVDLPDTQHLLDATSGRAFPPTRRRGRRARSQARRERDAEEAVDAALTEISGEALAAKIGLAIDAARAAYVMSEATIDSYETYHDTIASFYLALLQRTSGGPGPRDPEAVSDEAIALVDRAFRDRGGAEAAWAEARDGTNGGLRLVLDVMTEQLKTERQARHVDRVVKEILDPLDWEARAAFMGAFLKRLGPHLPPELRSQPPERFARHYPIVLQTYVQSLDRVKQLLRKL